MIDRKACYHLCFLSGSPPLQQRQTALAEELFSASRVLLRAGPCSRSSSNAVESWPRQTEASDFVPLLRLFSFNLLLHPLHPPAKRQTDAGESLPHALGWSRASLDLEIQLPQIGHPRCPSSGHLGPLSGLASGQLFRKQYTSLRERRGMRRRGKGKMASRSTKLATASEKCVCLGWLSTNRLESLLKSIIMPNCMMPGLKYS